jgi:hypothetical protein
VLGLDSGPAQRGVVLPAGSRRLPAARIARANDDPDVAGTFDFVTLTPGCRQIGPFTVTVGHVAHPVETFAFRFEHGGQVLTYSGDTGESPVLVELARSADILLCEASFPDVPDLPPGLHLSGRQAGQHAVAAGVRHLGIPVGEADGIAVPAVLGVDRTPGRIVQVNQAHRAAEVGREPRWLTNRPSSSTRSHRRSPARPHGSTTDSSRSTARAAFIG